MVMAMVKLSMILNATTLRKNFCLGSNRFLGVQTYFVGTVLTPNTDHYQMVRTPIIVLRIILTQLFPADTH